jgi:oxygen-independent coproporphyrinogen-3 oxidase
MMNKTAPLMNRTPSLMNRMPSLGAAGIYVHIPFCASKCHYCDFVSSAIGENPSADWSNKVESYLAALLQEAALYQGLLSADKACDQAGDKPFLESLYIGGGTPTILSARQLFLLLDSLQQTFQLAKYAEVTVEGNPGTIDENKLEALIIQGCNRLSLGVQSFKDNELRLLGRIHTRREAEDAYRLARRAGFANINLDLMYGLPYQKLCDWRKNLQMAVGMEPEHISLYQLNIEKGTPFFSWQGRGLLPEFAEEEALAMYEEAINYLTGAGYHHYEIGNFAKPAYESRHNQSYWKNREYVGLGIGASGYLKGVRYSNYNALTEYEAALAKGERPIAFTENIDPTHAMSEMMFLGLRMLDGVDKEEFFLRFGRTIIEQYGEAIDRLRRQGLLEETAQKIKLTRKGLYLANIVMLEFV